MSGEVHRDEPRDWHWPVEEWVGYPMTVCGRCMVPWPCPTAAFHDAKTSGTERDQVVCCRFHNANCVDLEEACCMGCPTWNLPPSEEVA